MGKLKQGTNSSIIHFSSNQYIGRKNIDDLILKQLSIIDEEITSNSGKISKHIINIFGESGIGKTTTQNHIIESLITSENKYRENKKPPIKYLYFNLNRGCLSKNSFIIRTIKHLRNKYSINDFICTTCALYMMSKSSGQIFDEDLLFQINEQINKKATKVAIRTAESIKYSSNILEIGGIILSSNGNSDKEIIDAFKKKAKITNAKSFDFVKSIIRADSNTIDENMMLYFAQDLRLIIHKLGTPIVCCIDSFDIQTAGTSLWDFEENIRELAEELPYILWVISGRDHFPNSFSGWNKLPVISIELLPFTETETTEYTVNANLPTEVSHLFYKLSKGNPRRIKQLHLKYIQLKENNDNYLDENKY